LKFAGQAKKMLDFTTPVHYNNEANYVGPESSLDLAGCIGGRENNV
jgi:hypothetical protein